jgi:hypothetical protein
MRKFFHNPLNALLLLMMVFPVLPGCEMQEETRPDPEIRFISPSDGQSFTRDTTMEAYAWLKGFTEDYTVHQVHFLINDSVAAQQDRYNETFRQMLETGSLPAGDHELSVKAFYTIVGEDDYDWNFFSARNYMEGEKKPDTLSVSGSVSITLTNK